MSQSLPDAQRYKIPSPRDPIAGISDIHSTGSDLVPLYGDPVWPLRFHSANPSVANVSIYWKSVPQEFESELRFGAWALINVPIPNIFLRHQAPAMRRTLSTLRIYHSVTDWRTFAFWLRSQGISSFGGVTPDVLESYAEHLEIDRRVARNTAVNHLTAITRLWIVGTCVPGFGFTAVPPWVAKNADDYLPAARKSGENETHAISTETMAPLLHWAMLVVEEFAPSILEAHKKVQGIKRDSAKSRSVPHAEEKARLARYFGQLCGEGAPIPSSLHAGRLVADCSYIAATVDCSIEAVWRWRLGDEIRAYFAANSAPILLPIEANGKGESVRRHVPLVEVPALVTHLETACYIIICYLTGMRPGEVLGLQTGCLEWPPESDRGWMHIRTRVFKTAHDASGNHESAGVMRSTPWIAVSPVVKAIRIMESIRPNGLLFASPQSIKNHTRSMSHGTATDRIQRFIAWVNDDPVAPGPPIPEDPRGPIASSRFRRTLAWHIANRPGGLVALAIQYGHLRTTISEGYASRSRDGVQTLIDFETARTIALGLSDTHDRFERGEEGISGPAVRRYLDALQEQALTFNGMVTSGRQAKALLDNPRLTIFKNDEAYLWCNYDPEKALCRVSRGDETVTPRLDRCQKGCSNITRTDTQAEEMRREASRLIAEADTNIAPNPMTNRLRKNAEELLKEVEVHYENRTDSQRYQ